MRIVFLFCITTLSFLLTAQISTAQSVSISGVAKKSYNGSDISCRGISDAEITIAAIGGSGIYEYSKNNGSTWQSSNVLTGIPGGANCIIKVRDANNISDVSNSKYVWVSNVNAVHINTFQRSTYYNDGGDGVSCVYNSDGGILFKADGGTGAFSYSLDNGATFQNSTHFTGLDAGTYEGLVTDANGCSASSSYTVTLSPPAPIVIHIVSQTNLSCSTPTGSVVVSGSGGKGNYKTSIDGGETFHYLAKNGTYTFSGLNEGAYNIIVKDGNYSTGCYSSLPVSITSNIDKATISGDANLSACTGSSANFNLNIATTGNETYTAIYQDNTGKNYTVRNLVPGDNTIITESLGSSKIFTLVSVTNQTGCSANVSGSVSVTVINPGTWLGNSSDWNDGNNWSCGAVPTSETSVTIPVTDHNPEISGTSDANNIILASGATLTVTGTLQLAGTISNNGTLNITTGTLEFIGVSPQTFSGSSFLNKAIDNLIISNYNGVNLSSTPNDTLNITGIISFRTSNAIFNTHNNLTLKSTATATASVGDLTDNGVYSGNAIIGNVTVERYINIGHSDGQHNKTWEMLATPTEGETIYQAWMENGDESVSGYGTQITGKGIGFDGYSRGDALKYYNDENNSWTGVTNTGSQVYNPLGYMLFVRGDRSTSYPQISNTTLRTTGTLITGTTTPVIVKAGKFQSVGNPYASAIDLRKIATTNLNPDIIVWDPTLTIGNPYGVGAYQTLYKDGGNYRNLLGSPIYGPAGTINNNIESGVAFFVQSFNREGQVYFTENSKAGGVGKGIAMREQNSSDNRHLSASLYVVNSNGSSYITDGAIQQFNTAYSNDIDGMDTRKIGYSSENFSILSGGKSLVVERRSLIASDTVFYHLTGVGIKDYRLIFNASGLQDDNLKGFIIDKYTKTETPLNSEGDTQLDFTVTSVPASKAPDRFSVVFRKLDVMPVTFSSVKAIVKNHTINVAWEVENQSNIKEYEVERSVDGNHFTKTATIAAKSSSSSAYNWTDEYPVTGYNYYRVKNLGMNGETSYSSIVKAQISDILVSFTVYPNPAIEHKVSIQFNNQPVGVYYARLLNRLGQVVVSQKIIHAAGNGTVNFQWNGDVARGIYSLQITKPDGSVKVIKVVY